MGHLPLRGVLSYWSKPGGRRTVCDQCNFTGISGQTNRRKGFLSYEGRKGAVGYGRVWPFPPETTCLGHGAACRDAAGRWWLVSRGCQRPSDSRAQPLKREAGVNTPPWVLEPASCLGLEHSERTTSNTKTQPRSLALRLSCAFSCAGCFQGGFSWRLKVIDE